MEVGGGDPGKHSKQNNQDLLVRVGTALAAAGVAFSPTAYTHLLSVVDNSGAALAGAGEDGGPLMWGLVPRAEVRRLHQRDSTV